MEGADGKLPTHWYIYSSGRFKDTYDDSGSGKWNLKDGSVVLTYTDKKNKGLVLSGILNKNMDKITGTWVLWNAFSGKWFAKKISDEPKSVGNEDTIRYSLQALWQRPD